MAGITRQNRLAIQRHLRLRGVDTTRKIRSQWGECCARRLGPFPLAGEIADVYNQQNDPSTLAAQGDTRGMWDKSPIGRLRQCVTAYNDTTQQRLKGVICTLCDTGAGTSATNADPAGAPCCQRTPRAGLWVWQEPSHKAHRGFYQRPPPLMRNRGCARRLFHSNYRIDLPRLWVWMTSFHPPAIPRSCWMPVGSLRRE